ncbi:MAG: tetratricopeptide repeat protein [Anaerolineales bacterium]|nr:tetratricopeptide repeat protein [Anaerolineales bacterium]
MVDDRTFEQELQLGDSISPVRANVLFAREIAYPSLLPSTTLKDLDDLARIAGEVIPVTGSHRDRGALLSEWLFGPSGFRGDPGHYQDPRNSYLNEVLVRKQGLPITLSTVFIAVAAKLGIHAHGIGLPGHFIVQVADGEQVVYLDPANGGGSVGLADCERLVSESTGFRGAFDRRWLKPTAPVEIVGRMLNNLRNLYTQADEWELARRTIERLALVQPDVASHRRDLGLIHYRLGERGRASQELSVYLSAAPNADDAEQIKVLREQMLIELGRLN